MRRVEADSNFGGKDGDAGSPTHGDAATSSWIQMQETPIRELQEELHQHLDLHLRSLERLLHLSMRVTEGMLPVCKGAQERSSQIQAEALLGLVRKQEGAPVGKGLEPDARSELEDGGPAGRKTLDGSRFVGHEVGSLEMRCNSMPSR
jgi:hypothetical protein